MCHPHHSTHQQNYTLTGLQCVCCKLEHQKKILYSVLCSQKATHCLWNSNWVCKTSRLSVSFVNHKRPIFILLRVQFTVVLYAQVDELNELSSILVSCSWWDECWIMKEAVLSPTHEIWGPWAWSLAGARPGRQSVVTNGIIPMSPSPTAHCPPP